MARGIDSLAHRGALQHPSGRTIAFLGSGLLDLYPPENLRLAAEIAHRGAVYSEYPLHAKPMPMHFPQRNRLISAASRGVLVVEARMDSGSFITVDHAVEQGRPVFAVPGPIQSRQSAGTHALIQQGATLVSCVEDIFHELRDLRAETLVRSGGVRVPPEVELDPEERRLLDSLTPTPSPVDLLARECGLEPRRLNELLLGLEMKGFVEQAPGRAYFRV
jgi:DNA processing protein